MGTHILGSTVRILAPAAGVGAKFNTNGIAKGRPPKLYKKIEEDLIAENQRLRMENEYLKKLSALVRKRMLKEEKKQQ